jgi:hypothetical protein
MRFHEWPEKNKFIPLPGDVQVVSETPEELIIEGSMGDKTEGGGGMGINRQIRCIFTARSGILRRTCKHSCTMFTTHDGKRHGYGGTRRTHDHIGFLMQNWP